MSQPTVLELCAGYNGLGMAVEEVFGARTVAFSEYDDAPSRILAHHYPDVPNYGDMTKIDWANIDPVDIISGGTPCQDLSNAGARRGMNEGTRSNLWVNMREAVAIQRPKYVVWENVRGAFSACASSEMGQCPGCVDRRKPHRPFLRALGRVLGDLSDLGYDCQWRGIRAGAETNEGYGITHVGSCHARFRVFVLAANRDHIGHERPRDARNRGEGSTHIDQPFADADDAGCREQWGSVSVRTEHPPTEHAGSDAANAESVGRGEGWPEPARVIRGLHAPLGSDSSPSDSGSHGRLRRQDNEGEGWPSGFGGKAVSDFGDGHPSRPEATSYANGGDDDGWLAGPEWDAVRRIAAAWRSETNWGEYEPGIRRWEFITGRRAPGPTEPTGRNNGHRLSPRFTEWMMGMPDGWVTDPAIGISRNEQLKACGNGVVPQQAVAALRDMLAAFQEQGTTS